MSGRHQEDCPICRARALDFTDEQMEFIAELLAVTAVTGWQERGIIDRSPTFGQMTRIHNRAMNAWTRMFGTAKVPESTEVAEHRRRGGHQ